MVNSLKFYLEVIFLNVNLVVSRSCRLMHGLVIAFTLPRGRCCNDEPVTIFYKKHHVLMNC
jgi:hypothetical protein